MSEDDERARSIETLKAKNSRIKKMKNVLKKISSPLFPITFMLFRRILHLSYYSYLDTLQLLYFKIYFEFLL